jgi:hypothetical protein
MRNYSTGIAKLFLIAAQYKCQNLVSVKNSQLSSIVNCVSLSREYGLAIAC